MFPQNSSEKVGGEIHLLKMKFDEYIYCNPYCLVLIRDETFEERINQRPMSHNAHLSEQL